MPPTQIAAPGVRSTGSTFLSTSEKGRPPSRANAYIMREHDVRPASAHKKFDTTMPMMISALRMKGIAETLISQLKEFQPCLAPAATPSVTAPVAESV